MRRLSKIKIKWSSRFAYAIGLITTDGSLSIDERHINFTSKDEDLVVLFKKYLDIDNKIGRKARGGEKEKKYYQIQFGDRNFYDFLLSIGLMPAKSKKLKGLSIPNKYFADFLRGCIDGDGSIKTFKHPESKYPQLRVSIASASKKFLDWLQRKNYLFGLKGYIMEGVGVYVLQYAMTDSIKLLRKVYYKNCPASLNRKLLSAKVFLRT